MKNYQILEHTADVGVRVRARDLKGLFRNMALAMFDIMAEPKSDGRKPRLEIKVKQSADNLEELLINWLNELLYLSAAKELFFSDFKIGRLDKKSLEARAIGYAIKNYKVNTEIKAATYHELKIEKNRAGWLGEVIFDV